jgi:hypothetical protein
MKQPWNKTAIGLATFAACGVMLIATCQAAPNKHGHHSRSESSAAQTAAQNGLASAPNTAARTGSGDGFYDGSTRKQP